MPEPETTPPAVPVPGLRDQIAGALRDHYLVNNRNEADADGNAPCACGGWREPGPMGSEEDDWDSHLADVALAALDNSQAATRAGNADRIVAYRSLLSGGLFCLSCAPADRTIPLTSDDLSGGGMCCACEADVFAVEAARAEADAQLHLIDGMRQNNLAAAAAAATQRAETAEAALARVRDLHDRLTASDGLTDPEDAITRAAAARRIAAALDGYTPPVPADQPEGGVG